MRFYSNRILRAGLALLCVSVMLLVSFSWFGSGKSTSSNDDEYYAVPTVPVDDLVHTAEHPFCSDNTCPCHEDEEEIGKVNEDYQEGLYTAPEATRRVKGWWL